MEQFSIEKFVEGRDKALFSLDYEKIKKFCRKYHIQIGKPDVVFWGGVHKAILGITNATMGQKEASVKWLLDHGFKTDLAGNRLEA